MARKDAKMDMTVDVINNADSGLQEVEKSVERTAKSMQRAGKKTTKDWGGVGDLFTTLLPRGMQRTIRSFKSTQRSVGRLSKGFKILKAAWASVGIGLAIIAIEKLVENWDKWSAALGLTNPELEHAQELNKKVADQQERTSLSIEGYLKAITDVNTEEGIRKTALAEVNAQLGNYVDAQADANTQAKQAQEILDAKNRLDEANIRQSDKIEGILKKRGDVERDLALVQRGIAGENAKFMESLVDQQKRFTEELATVEGELAALNAEQLAAQTAYNELVEVGTTRTQERRDAEADLKKTKNEADREAEANAKYLANLEKTLSEEIMLAKIEDEEERQLKVLELRLEADRKKLEEAGGTWEDLLLLAEMYELDKAAIEKSFKNQKDAEDEADRQRTLAEEQALEDEMYVIRTDGRDRELTAEQLKHEEEIMMSYDAQAKEELRAAQEFDRRMLQAGENHELVKMVEEEYENELTAIAEKGEEERADIVQDAADLDIKVRKASMKRAVQTTSQMFGTMEALAEENSDAQKGFAIAGVLLNQALALSSGIKTAGESSLTVWDYIGNIAVITTAILGSFVGIKSILNEATDGGGGSVGGGGGGRPNVQALVPSGVARLDSPEEGNNQAYVVQSELEGANMQANNMYGQTSLNPG
tara:strand:- start:307 stop:2256 length:1950 start_codon:yes stop_codon:yes gene_type:complete